MQRKAQYDSLPFHNFFFRAVGESHHKKKKKKMPVALCTLSIATSTSKSLFYPLFVFINMEILKSFQKSAFAITPEQFVKKREREKEEGRIDRGFFNHGVTFFLPQ